MTNDFICLGYGGPLAEALCNWKATQITWTNGRTSS